MDTKPSTPRRCLFLLTLLAAFAAGPSLAGTAGEIGREIGKGSREAAEATKEAGKTFGEKAEEWGKSFWEGLKDFGKSLKEGWSSGDSGASGKEKSKGPSR